MPLGFSLKFLAGKLLRRSERGASKSIPSSRKLVITCRGRPIGREDLFKYSNGRFLINEDSARSRRYITFNLDELCAVAASADESKSPVLAIEKMEGGFSKALLMQREDGSEMIAKIPFPIAGPPKYTTASEVAVLQYIRTHTQIPVPKVLAWSSDATNPVGAEYNIMEKAPGVQLFTKWKTMTKGERLQVIKNLARIDGELGKIRFPEHGSLYLRESMSDGDRHTDLDHDRDPTEQFCIGPTCEREWYPHNEESLSPPCFDSGPWQTISTYGIALIERERLRIEQNPPTNVSYPPRGTCREHMSVLDKSRLVMEKLGDLPLIGDTSQPVLFHTDLHMGNVYVAEDDPGKIISIIDWQSTVIAPLLIQARFPEFLVDAVDDEYTFGMLAPQLPVNYDELDEGDKVLAKSRYERAVYAKTYELATAMNNTKEFKALQLPDAIRELFIRTGEASKEGIVPLRECLIELSKTWSELGFTDECPFVFTEEEVQIHEEQYAEYRKYHRVQGIARELLDTDSEGWIPPIFDFERMRTFNKEVLEKIMQDSHEFGYSPEEIRRIWPFLPTL